MASRTESLHTATICRARLPSKPSVELCYSLSYVPSEDVSCVSPLRLIVFLNNLLMPASSWEAPIALLKQKRDPAGSQSCKGKGTIPILTYDRFGQGATTDRDPLDSRPITDPGYGHDFADVVSDLHSLISILVPQLYPHHGSVPTRSDNIALLLVGASIGGPLARIYADTYPHTVAGIILLDSNIANANYSSFWPDPTAPNFDPDDVVAPDCTLDQYIKATRALAAMFDLDVKNRENLDRRNTPELLPYANRPQLLAPFSASGGEEGNGECNKLAKIMVVGHDTEAFADEGLEKMGTPRSFTKRWLQKAWDRYNQGLLEIGDSDIFGCRVKVAKGCGHFIQRDDPKFVADVVEEMLVILGW